MKRLLVVLTVALSVGFAFGQSVFDIKINEVLASGETEKSPEGRGYDRVELYNPTGADIPIGGAALSDGSFLTKHVLPAGTIIPAGGFYVVNLDPGNTNGNHFNLTRSGDTVVFGIDVFGTINPIQAVTFGAQLIDVSFGAVPDGSDNFVLLSSLSFGATNTVATYGDMRAVKINEWVANWSKADFVELYNTGTDPVNLHGLTIEDSTSAPYPFPPLTFIGTGDTNGFQVFEAVDASGGSSLPFKFGGTDSATLRTPEGEVIDTATWSNLGDNDSQGRVPDGGDSILTFKGRPTPGAPNFGLITEVVFNELLTHTDLPLEDAVEFHNTNNFTVNIGGWYLGGIEYWKENPKGNKFIERLKRYQFPANTIIPPGGFLTVYEWQFRNNPLDDNFTFNSAHGGSVFLSKPDDQGNIIAYLERSYKPSANGVSFGRMTTSDGDVDFVAMSKLTFGQKAGKPFRGGLGATNTALPMWGPIIISEIMYAPTNSDPAITNENTLDEYVELRNVTKSRLPLFDPLATTNGWRVDSGIEYTFTNGNYIEANGYLLLVNFDPSTNVTQLNAFRSRHALSGDVPIFGPYKGNLGDDDIVELYRPDPPQGANHPEDEGFVPQILIDRVHYENGSKTKWPTNSHLTGMSLQRVSAPSYGDEPLSWRDDLPTPGAINAIPLVITSQPASYSVVKGGTASFTVAVTGSEPQYHWLFKNRPLKPTKLRPLIVTNATLYIQNAARQNAGVYSAVITNLAGGVTSDAGTLTVIDPIVIKIPARPITLTKKPGTPKLVLRAKAIGTLPQYQWYKDGQPIEGATGTTYTLLNLTSDMNGDYYFVALNRHADGSIASQSTSQHYTLTVQ